MVQEKLLDKMPYHEKPYIDQLYNAQNLQNKSELVLQEKQNWAFYKNMREFILFICVFSWILTE